MLDGVTDTVTVGMRLMIPLADWLGVATDVAVTVTACAAVMVAGAVYTPAVEMLPTFELNDHATD